MIEFKEDVRKKEEAKEEEDEEGEEGAFRDIGY